METLRFWPLPEKRPLVKMSVFGILSAVANITYLQHELRACASHLPDAAPESHSLSLSDMFVEYAKYDQQPANERSLAPLFLAWAAHTKTPANATLAWALQQAEAEAAREVTGTAQFLERALAECTAIAHGDRGRPITPPRPPPAARLTIDAATGYFATADDGSGPPKIYLPFGINERPVSSGANRSAVPPSLFDETFYDLPLFPSSLMPAPFAASDGELDLVVARLDAALARGLRAEILLSQYALPAWAARLYPNLTKNVGVQHSCGFDIDHPAARTIWDAIFAKLIPRIAPHPGLLTLALDGEPGFAVANSTYTFAKYRAWLERAYNGSIAALNAAWRRPGGPLPSFAAIHTQPLGWQRPATTCSEAEWYDWHAFNNARVTEWYAFLRNSVQRHAASVNASVACNVKVSNEGSGGLALNHVQGIDRSRRDFAEHFFRSSGAALHTATGRILILAQCSAIS